MFVPVVSLTGELGHLNELHEWTPAGGEFDLGGDIKWTSFRQTFCYPEKENLSEDHYIFLFPISS